MKQKINLQQLCSYLDNYLAIATFTDYGPNGLQVEGRKEIAKIATAVSVNLELIEKCASKNIDALIVHHGLFWKGDAQAIVGVRAELLKALLKAEISLLAYHLPLDAHQVVGNNWKAAQELSWSHLQPFDEIGVQGTIDLTLHDLEKKLSKYYQHEAFVAPFGKKRIEKVALVSGGAYRRLQKAAQEGLDAFITGNFDEPAWWVAKEHNIHFLALGHHATEKIGPKALAEHLSTHFSLSVEYFDQENPF